MQKISSHLWFDTQAKEAAQLYTTTFKNSSIKQSTVLHGTPSGDVDMLTIDLSGQEFTLISAGPYFTFTPAVSFVVNCESKEEVDRLWGVLSEGGSVLMELGSYPFSERYGWLKDRFGLSWQLIFAGDQAIKQAIVPSLLFVGDVCGKTEEAINFYTSVFHESHIDNLMRYNPGEEPEQAGTIRHGAFTIEGVAFTAMDSAREHKFGFNEAVSFIVHCDTQEQIDYYWNKLSADPNAEQCGWLKDKFGLSWQITPTTMDEMMANGSAEQIERVTKAFLQMKKFDLATLEQAYAGA